MEEGREIDEKTQGNSTVTKSCRLTATRMAWHSGVPKLSMESGSTSTEIPWIMDTF